MAQVRGALCDKKTDSSYNGVKRCRNCCLWFCYDHAGPGRTQCPKCGKRTLE